MPEKPGIPAWQRAQPSAAPAPAPALASEEEPQPSEEQPEVKAEAPSAPEENQSTKDDTPSQPPVLLEQARQFLEDPAVRDSPREKKVAFLQSKGVGAEDIEKLLASSPEKDASSDVLQDGERAWSKSTQSSTQPAAAKPRDIPPIVTYPEFLAQPVKPPPLITTQRLLNTAYVAGGLMATMYGLSKFIIAPMSQKLAESRHDLFGHTKENLDEFNTRLADLVSVDPAHKAASTASEAVDDISEAGSDPTELFHRDIGTQTTPTLSRKTSDLESDTDTSTTASHARRMNIITSHLKELEEIQATKETSHNSLRTVVSDLESYLTEMSYQTSYYNPMPGLYGGTYGLPKSRDGKDDQVEAVKADIRAVKGVFLNARNFPTGGKGAVSRLGA